MLKPTMPTVHISLIMPIMPIKPTIPILLIMPTMPTMPIKPILPTMPILPIIPTVPIMPPHRAHHSHICTFAHLHIAPTPCLAFLTPCLGIFTPCLGVTTSWYRIPSPALYPSPPHQPPKNRHEKKFSKNCQKSLEHNKLFVPLHRYPCEKGKQQRAEPKATSLKAQKHKLPSQKPQDLKTTLSC